MLKRNADPAREPPYRNVRVVWSPPSGAIEVIQKMRNADDHGVYQVYGTHVVFGPGALLYIGEAVEQTFGKRFEQHAKFWLPFESDVVVRVGRVVGEDCPDEEDRRAMIGHVEALTIYWHSPPYNSKNIVAYDGIALRVQNHGDRGRLLPEYSSHWKPVRPIDK